ncbi:hypothetical protein FHY05_001836 [Sphingomonas sp. BK580]|nr:hypothetical protein [Sphingomonas sp. BK580]
MTVRSPAQAGVQLGAADEAHTRFPNWAPAFAGDHDGIGCTAGTTGVFAGGGGMRTAPCSHARENAGS